MNGCLANEVKFRSVHLMKTALITGSSRGLGRHLATTFWENGWSLLLVARDLEELSSLRSELPNYTDQECIIKKCDLSDLSQVKKLCAKISQDEKNIDALINNAATQGTIGALSDVNSDDLQKVFNVNLFAPMELCKCVLRGMKIRNFGSIVNISGGGGASPRPRFYPYSLSKVSLIRFTENLANELNHTKIKINCIAPGIMNTKMMEEIISAGIEKSGVTENKIAQKFIMSEDNNFDKVTSLIEFLVSSTSNGITGKLISAQWDNWEVWPKFINKLKDKDLYTLRRIVGSDRNFIIGDA